MAFGNVNLVTDLVLGVIFTIINAKLFYVHNLISNLTLQYYNKCTTT